MRKIIPIIFLGFSLSACASFQTKNSFSVKRPTWINGSDDQYPNSFYLTGVGSGGSHASSGNSARAEIAKIISSRVTVHDNVSEAEGTQMASGKTKNTFSQSVSQAVEVASQEVLRGVRVVKYWENPLTKNYYALAVMDRQKASISLNDKISRIDHELKDWDDTLNTSKEKFGRARAAMKVLALLKAREHLAQELEVISATGQAPACPIDESKAKVRVEKALSALVISVHISGKDGGIVETGVVEGLNGLGMSAVVDYSTKTPDILIEGKLSSEKLTQLPPPWKWGKSQAIISLENALSKAIFAQFNAEDRQASSISHSDAVNRSEISLARKVSKKIHDAIAAYFENI